LTGNFDFSSQPAQPPPPPQHPLPIADRAKAVSVVFAIWIAAAALSGLHDLTLMGAYSEIAQASSASAAEQQLMDLAFRELGVAAIVLLVNLATGITYLVWLYRARDNAERLSTWHRHRRSRAWLFWGWVVPVVSFWFPYQIVADIRAASLRADHNADTSPSLNLLNWWWALFLLYSFGGAFAFIINSNAGTAAAEVAEAARNSLLVGLLLLPVGIAAALLAVQVVRGISALQSGEQTQHPQ
jgi:heme/copper-type cytochrome/quinol oxidase subunit 2